VLQERAIPPNNNQHETDDDCEDGGVAGAERVFVERIEAIVERVCSVPHDSRLECVATATIALKHCSVDMQPRVCKHTVTTGVDNATETNSTQLTSVALHGLC